MNGKLPKGWVWSSISGVCLELIGGGTPSRENPEYFGGDVIWLTPTEIPKDRIAVLNNSKEQITQKGLERSSARIIPKGAVLLTSRASIGFVAIAGCNVTTNQGFASFICSEALFNLYLSYWLWANRASLKANATGTTFKEISKAKLRELAFPLAPLPEQRRIVGEIEKQFTRLDAGVAALNRIRSNLKRYRAAVLKAACEGRLVPTEAGVAKKERRGYESADKLLERILTERCQKWQGRGKYKEPGAPDTINLPPIPEGWTWATVEQLSNVVRGASPRPAGDPKYFGGAIPWITVGPITADRNPYLKSVPNSLNETGREHSRYIEPHTLLLTNSGATLGVPKITLIGGCINDGVAALLDVDYPLKLYLLYFLHTQTERLRGVNQGAAQPNLNTTIIKAVYVPLPPLAEQERIVAEMERRLSVCDELGAMVDTNLKRAARLRQAILKRAFEGKLVPQDPKDEPASVLLERIKKEGENPKSSMEAAKNRVKESRGVKTRRRKREGSGVR